MSVDWTPLRNELRHWQADDLEFPLWWRDDDAISVTDQLKTLTAISESLELPVHLAVIPQEARTSLVDFCADSPFLIPVVHGWAHQNHAPDVEKKSEFRLHRPMAEMVAEIKNGKNKLGNLFGDRLCPMFVPPWNRIAAETVQQLPILGFRFLSTATPRETRFIAPGLEQINTHIDPIDWHGTRSLIEPDIIVGDVVSLLRDRREGLADNSEPLGVLTHHLVHDQAVWAFTRELIVRLLEGPATVWADLETLNNQGDHG
ncbi:polysaccharide deacetylase family protein [Ruegeria arenilitoris]|uniref:polysaccharide deacetylase family protein n=1 Tax=Ruegeria arenilitoris TaxID=1173585 RepID=UPI00147D06E0|nr:polysaccharide deacetylase family protein [Ruegeria arenilitoris]